MAKDNRFAALRELRDKRQEEEVQEQTEPTNLDSEPVEEGTVTPPVEPLQQKKKPPEKSKVAVESKPQKAKKRGPGRPRGRRSDPDYTQISAYIPLELLLEVQDELAEERREKLKRTPRPVSDLMEELLADWLKKRKRKKSGS
ncbi:MAG: hypothetical protein AAF609_13595 [Cyanobacteria bacterium P01_C01_bin.120]